MHDPSANNNLVDEELLQEMKFLFANHNQCTIANIIRTVNLGQIAEAHRLVHTLKSSALLIGETRLSNIAHEAEDSFKINNKLPQELFHELETELCQVLNKLKITSQSEGNGQHEELNLCSR